VVIAGVPERASALDVLVTRDGDLRPGRASGHPASAVGRRCSGCEPDVIVEDLRGNVDTRLRKLATGRSTP
jgi:hydroxymethylbilane synthase